jgi:taurine dioxygenase
MTTAITTLDVRPLTGCIGAEVFGVDLAHLDDRTWREVRAAWLEHLVLFFPDQHLDPDAHIAVGRLLGDIEVHPYIPKLDDAHPEIVVLDSDHGAKADTWHTDVTFSATPPRASILQMMVSPAHGGDTLWTNQYLAYETLSTPLRDLLDGLTAVHTAAPFGHPEVTATHPVVRTHPETGRRSLFVNRTFTSHVVELRREESAVLLGHLYAWSEQPRFQCRYRWQPGTIGMWDNRCTQHHAVNDYEERRVITRVTVLGDRPAGGEPKWPPFADDRTSVASAYDRAARQPIGTDPRANSIEVPA